MGFHGSEPEVENMPDVGDYRCGILCCVLKQEFFSQTTYLMEVEGLYARVFHIDEKPVGKKKLAIVKKPFQLVF